MEQIMKDNYFLDLSKVDVTKHVEKKGAFSYLSWPFAVSQLRQFDPTATWEVKRFDGLPYLACELGVFVEVAVTVQGVILSQIHPVLDSKNRPIVAPTSFDINTSIQRCLVKAIALHGLGLTVYAGEDLPLVDGAEEKAPARVTALPPAEPGTPILPGDTITAAQVRYIKKLISETNTELQKVLDYFGLESIESIAKADASRVIRSLEQARSRKEAA
jgi:hypothetical protein